MNSVSSTGTQFIRANLATQSQTQSSNTINQEQGQRPPRPPKGGGNDDKAKMAEKLMGMGVPENIIKQGKDAVDQYLSSNSDSSSSDNNESQSSQGGLNKAEFAEKLMSLDIPEDIIKEGPQSVRNYMKENEITVDRSGLNESTSLNFTQNFESTLAGAGVSLEMFQQASDNGSEDLMQLFQQFNLKIDMKS